MEWENPQDTSNQSEWSWEDQWEPPVFGGAELACVTGVCVLLLATGIMGNMLTILVVWLRPQLRSSTYLYLSSMAVSDLLILFLMPLDLYKLWHPRPWRLGDLVCKVSMFASESCTFSSLLHITALSLERYLAVCRPLAAKTLLTRRRTRALIGCLWGAALLSAAPVLLMVGVEELGAEELGAGELGAGELGAGEGRGGSECRCTDYAVSSGLLATMMWLSNLYFLVPLGILGLVYGLIGRKLWLRPLRNSRDRAQRNTVKMLGMIVLVFVLCWLPFHVGRTLFSLSLGSTPGVYHTHNHTHTHTHSHTHTERLLEEESEPEAEFQADVLYYVSQYFNLASFVLFYLSAAVNPLLYNTMSARYRQALRSLLHTHTHSSTHTHSHTQRSRLPPLTPQHSTTTL